MKNYNDYLQKLEALSQNEATTKEAQELKRQLAEMEAVYAELQNFYFIHQALIQNFKGVDNQFSVWLNKDNFSTEMTKKMLPELTKLLKSLASLKMDIMSFPSVQLIPIYQTPIQTIYDYILSQMTLFEIETCYTKYTELITKNEQQRPTYLQEQAELVEKKAANEKAERERVEKLEIERLKDENAILKETVVKQEKDIKHLNNSKQQFDTKMSTMSKDFENKVKSLNVNNESIQKLQETIINSNLHIDNQKTIILNVMNENHQIKNENRQIENENKQILILKNDEIRELERKQRNLLKQAEDKAFETETLRKQLDVVREKHKVELEVQRTQYSSLAEINTMYHITKPSIENMQWALAQKQTKFDELKKDIEKLEERKKQMTKHIEDMPKSVKKARQELISLNNEKADIHNMILKRIDEYSDRMYSVYGLEYIIKKSERLNIPIDEVCDEYRELIKEYKITETQLYANFYNWKEYRYDNILRKLLDAFTQYNNSTILAKPFNSHPTKNEVINLAVSLKELISIIEEVRKSITQLSETIRKSAKVFEKKNIY